MRIGRVQIIQAATDGLTPPSGSGMAAHTLPASEVYGYSGIVRYCKGMVRYWRGMTPGMRVCSPLYPTAGILRGIFDFEPGHRETSDKWLFVFRKRESIIIIHVFNKSINNSRRRNRKLIICFIDHHLKTTFSSCFGHLRINVCFLTVWFGFQNPSKIILCIDLIRRF